MRSNLFVVVALLPATSALNETRFLLNQSLASTTCSGAFNTPCAITAVHELVEEVLDEIKYESKALWGATVLNAASSKGLFFWANVFDADGNYVLTGMPTSNALTSAGYCLKDGVFMNGCASGTSAPYHVEDVAHAEVGIDQPNLWQRMVAAAESDGYYDFLGHDGFHGHVHTQEGSTPGLATRLLASCPARYALTKPSSRRVGRPTWATRSQPIA